MKGMQPDYLVTFKALYQAWQACQKRKAGKPAAQRFEMHLLDRLFYLQQQLQQGIYQTTASYSFVTTQPKLREIHAANFGDRVVHHLLVPRLEALWEPWFIYDVYSNRKYKGTHKAVKRLQAWMRKPCCQYYLQLDIKNFFYSIKQHVLLEFLYKGLCKAHRQYKITAEQQAFYTFLCQQLIKADFSNTQNINPSLASRVPVHKRLLHQPKGQGLPIGNLSSQFFANVYLNALDQFVKHRLKCQHYVRFVDDFILLAKTPQQLQLWQEKIQLFLQSELSLTLKKGTQLKPVQQGADFLGYIVKPYFILVRKRVFTHLNQKLNAFKNQCLQGLKNRWLWVDALFVDTVHATLASYIGHCKHAHSLKRLQAIWKEHRWLSLFFDFDVTTFTLQLKTQSPKGANYLQQIMFFRKHYPTARLQVQFGRNFKCYMPMSHGMGYQAHEMCLQVNLCQAGFRPNGGRRRQVQRFLLSASFIRDLCTKGCTDKKG